MTDSGIGFTLKITPFFAKTWWWKVVCRYCYSYWRSDGVANCINSPLNYTIAIMQSSLQFECTHGFKSISKSYVRAQSATPAVVLLSEIFFELSFLIPRLARNDSKIAFRNCVCLSSKFWSILSCFRVFHHVLEYFIMF